MTLFSLLPAVLLASMFVSPTPGTNRQKPDREVMDSVISGRKVLTLAAFDQLLAESGSKAGIPPDLRDRIREDFKTRFADRIVALPEWGHFLLMLCYQHNVPFPAAQEYHRLLRDLRPSTVDVGFLAHVRIVDLTEEILYRIGRLPPESPKVSPPTVLCQPLPAYTEAAREDRIEGTVLLEADVLSDGSVANVRVTRPLGYGLDEAAVLTVQDKWKFRPGQRDGQPVNVRANIEVSFRLD